MDSWPQLETKLVEYAKVEAPTWQVIAKCLKTLEEGDEDELHTPQVSILYNIEMHYCRFSLDLAHLYLIH